MTVVANDADSTSPENDVTYTIPGEQQHEKTCPRGFRSGPSQTGLYRRWLKTVDISELGSRGIVLALKRKQR